MELIFGKSTLLNINITFNTEIQRILCFHIFK